MAAGAQSVPAPAWALTYQGRDITADVSAMLVELAYTDVLAGASGDLELVFEDRDEIWAQSWKPARGDSVALTIALGTASLQCGNFQVDELEYHGAPDTLHMRCLHTSITAGMRTSRSLGYENVTVLQVAQQVAARQTPPLTVVDALGALGANYARLTQDRETDLEFLHRLGNEHGFDFTVRGNQMVFYPRTALQSQAPVLTLTRASCTRYTFKLASARTFRAGSATYFDPATKSLVAAGATSAAPSGSGDTLRVYQRVENAQQAATRVAAQLHGANMLQATAQIEMPGDPTLVAGVTVTVAGWGMFDGPYLVRKAVHRIARARGYTTELELRTAGG